MASKDVLVCGTLNLETTFPIAGFPLNYEAICYRPFEIRSQPSGVGFNIARALSTFGNRVRLASMVGSDFLGTVLRQSMPKFGLSGEFICPSWTKRRSQLLSRKLFENVSSLFAT